MLAVIIFCLWVSGIDACIDKRTIERVKFHIITCANTERTVATSKIITAFYPGLSFFKIRKAIFIAPAFGTRRLPFFEVLRIAALGHSNKEIAAELYLSVNTVRNHMQHVLNKLGAHSKLEATAIAVKAGILRR